MNKITTILTKRFYFNSAHKMANESFSDAENQQIFGLCRNIHGHNYFLDVSVSGEMDKDRQWIVDLEVVKNIVKETIISVVDHRYLNDVLAQRAKLRGLPLTLENLGAWIWEELVEEFKKNRITLEKINLAESDTTSLTISK